MIITLICGKHYELNAHRTDIGWSIVGMASTNMNQEQISF